MSNGELKPDINSSPTKPNSAQWQWFLGIVLVVGAVEPIVGYVRSASEPHVGSVLAYGVGILAAAAVALPIFAAASWIIQRENSEQSAGIAPMIYRPAVLPGAVFIGTVLKNFPNALTEAATYGFLGGFVILMAIAVLLQKRSASAWSWSFAVFVSFGIALLAMLLAGVLSLAVGQRP